MNNPTTRRHFLQRAGLGCGSLALTNLLHQQGVVAAERSSNNPLAERPAPTKGRAKAVIWLFQTGSPSQVDTFDYKPELQKRTVPLWLALIPRPASSQPVGSC